MHGLKRLRHSSVIQLSLANKNRRTRDNFGPLALLVVIFSIKRGGKEAVDNLRQQTDQKMSDGYPLKHHENSSTPDTIG